MSFKNVSIAGLVFVAFLCSASVARVSPQNQAAPSNEVEQIKLSEILIPLVPSASAEQVASAEKEAHTIIDDLNAGIPFDQEAREHSKGPTAAQGGNVGYFARGVLPAQIETQVFHLKVGAITNPIRTKQGFVIIKVTDRATREALKKQGNVDILTDTGGVDFRPYLSSALATIRKNWYALMPDEARQPLLKRGAVAIVFSIRKDGNVEGIKIFTPSGEPEFDRAAWGGNKCFQSAAAFTIRFCKGLANSSSSF